MVEKKEGAVVATEGKDLSKILVDSKSIQEYDIPYKGEVFHFKVRELPWVQLTQIASRSLDYSGKKVTVDKSEFDVQFLEAALVEAPWPLSQTRMVVRRLNRDFGTLLRNKIIPEPFTPEDEELKNE
jgi:hypothetical protein